MPNRRAGEKSPRSRPRSAAPGTDLALGIDLGATKVVSALVAPDGTIVHHGGTEVHGNDGPDNVIRSLVEGIHRCLRKAPSLPLPPIGVSVAAQVDPETGTVVHAPNLRWRDVPLAGRISEALHGARVVVLNDARAATLAEWRLGAGQGTNDLVCMVLGTGVGGSAVVGGHLLEGRTHALGEVGHVTVMSGGRRCHCPNFGCLEAYVGGWAIAERAQEAVRADPVAGAALLTNAGSVEAISARTVFSVYRARDAMAERIVRETERYLADGAVSVVNSFNPEMLVLAGGLVAGMPEFVNVVEGAVRSRCQPPAAGARVTPARFGELAPLVGAAVAARQPARPAE